MVVGQLYSVEVHVVCDECRRMLFEAVPVDLLTPLTRARHSSGTVLLLLRRIDVALAFGEWLDAEEWTQLRRCVDVEAVLDVVEAIRG